MMLEIVKASNEDFEDIIDFANYVFSHSSSSVDFPELLPKLYKKKYDTVDNHYIVKENGKIKAIVGSFPQILDVAGNKLKVAGIGTVCVHPYSRGSGYMKKLMNMALEDMKKDGIHISCLSGKKQRYEYFGYIPCGQKIYSTINNENIKHKLGNYISNNIIFKEILEDDEECINKAYNLYNKSKYKIIREKERFLDILRSWNFNVYSVIENNNFIGYVSVSNDKKYISELIVNNEEDYLRVIANYIEFNNIDEVNIEIPIWEKYKINKIYDIAEESIINNCYQFNIINYEETIEALLKFKAAYSKLDDGRLTINILEYGSIEISVRNNCVNVNKYCGETDIKISHLKAMELFFSPFSKFIVEGNKIINSWFPIPLFIQTQDKV